MYCRLYTIQQGCPLRASGAKVAPMGGCGCDRQNKNVLKVTPEAFNTVVGNNNLFTYTLNQNISAKFQ